MASRAARCAASSSRDSSLADSDALPGAGDARGLPFDGALRARGAGLCLMACKSGETGPVGAQRGTEKDCGPSPPMALKCLTQGRARKGMPARTTFTTVCCSLGEYRDWSRAETRAFLAGGLA